MEEVVIPATATKVSSHAFMIHELFGDISVLKKITVASGNKAYKSIGGVVYSADGVDLVAVPQAIESLEISKEAKYIQEYAFYGCTGLTSLYIPDNIVYLSGGALRNTTRLVDLRLPQGMEDISWGVFQGCTSLKRIYIPKLVESGDYHGYGSGIFSSSCSTE